MEPAIGNEVGLPVADLAVDDLAQIDPGLTDDMTDALMTAAPRRATMGTCSM